MNRTLWQKDKKSLLDDQKTFKKIEFNDRKNREQDNTEEMDELSRRFDYEACKNEYWNPEHFSFLYGTRLWNEATPSQRVKLNQIYWVAYYSQIISAEIATIFFNQTSAAALYGVEDFRLVCDTLDLESKQERAHINAFKVISEQFEEKVFGERLLTYPMRTPFAQTMVFSDTNAIRDWFRKLQLQAFTVLSSGSAFIGCQYFTVRGIRTLNGKIVQHQLSRYYTQHADKENAPIPSKISYHHFMDESFHFNTSNIVSHDILHSIAPPTKFESWVANLGLAGTQRDHFHFSTAINGLFWYDPALYSMTYRLLRSELFGMDHEQARQMMWDCFARDSDGVQASFKSRTLALNSYREYLSTIHHVDKRNRELAIMNQNSFERHMAVNTRALKRFFRSAPRRENQLLGSPAYSS